MAKGNRFKYCCVQVDRDSIKRLAQFHFGSVGALCEKLGWSRQRYNFVVSKPHSSIDCPSLTKLAKTLGINIKNYVYMY